MKDHVFSNTLALEHQFLTATSIAVANLGIFWFVQCMIG